MTSLREKLAWRRPSLAALARLERLGLRGGNSLPKSWRSKNLLASAQLMISGGKDLLDLADVGELTAIAVDLKKNGKVPRSLKHVDLGQLQGSDYDLTRAIARGAFDQGFAGVEYRSRFDGLPSLALFEGRAKLLPTGDSRLLSEVFPELEKVCDEFGIKL